MFRLFILGLIFLNVNCKNEPMTSIKLSDYKMYSLKEKHTSVILLKSFITNTKCDSLKGIYYANIYMCMTTISNDTILVFSVCKKTYDFLQNDYKGDRDLILDSSKIFSDFPKQVFSNIDDTILKKRYNYIFADLIKLEY